MLWWWHHKKIDFWVIYFQEICNKLIASQQYYTTTCFINNPIEFTSHTEQKKVNEYIFQIITTKHTPRLSLKCLLYFFLWKKLCWYVHISFKFNKKSRPHPNRITLKSFIAPLSVASGLIMHQFYSFLLRRRCQRGRVLSIIIIFGPYRFCTLPLLVVVHHKNHYLINFIFASHLNLVWDYFWPQPDQITHIGTWLNGATLFFYVKLGSYVCALNSEERSGIAPRMVIYDCTCGNINFFI